MADSTQQGQDEGEVHLVADERGIAVVGAGSAVSRFLETNGLSKFAVELDIRQAMPRVANAVQAAEAAAKVASVSGRWIKLTEESAALVREYGLMETKTPGVRHAMIGEPGTVRSWLQIEGGLGAQLTNPAVLAGVANLMAQVASRQAAAEVTAYLRSIDGKLDDVRRALRDERLARVDGAAARIQEAQRIREETGRVSEVTWNKIQTVPESLADVQSYALRQLGGLADKLEVQSGGRSLARSTEEVAREVNTWLAVLARCAQLHDWFIELELDRVLDAAPQEVDAHRVGLAAACQDRADVLSAAAGHLLKRMDLAVGLANLRIVWSRQRSTDVIDAANDVAADVAAFSDVLALGLQDRRWEARELGGFADFGSKAIQKTKEMAPGAAVATIVVLGVAKRGTGGSIRAR